MYIKGKGFKYKKNWGYKPKGRTLYFKHPIRWGGIAKLKRIKFRGRMLGNTHWGVLVNVRSEK